MPQVEKVKTAASRHFLDLGKFLKRREKTGKKGRKLARRGKILTGKKLAREKTGKKGGEIFAGREKTGKKEILTSRRLLHRP